MWVCSSGWIDEVIATPRVKSTSRGPGAVGADDRLGVGAGQLAEPGERSRQRALVPHPVQQPLGAEVPAAKTTCRR